MYPHRQRIAALRDGVELDDGVTAPADGTASCSGARRARAVEIAIHEGRNRQVRRMCDAIGHPVVRLVRTRIGPLADRRLRRESGVHCNRTRCGRCTRRPRRGLPIERRPMARVVHGAPRLTSLVVRLQALRGAITCDEDSKAEIDAKTTRMVKELFARNDLAAGRRREHAVHVHARPPRGVPRQCALAPGSGSTTYR